MKKMISADEQIIKGKWLFENHEIRKDANSMRIEWLIKNHLKWISKDTSGWLNLYKDPDDQRYWELQFEDSDFHGGGPPTLICISADAVAKRYNI